MYTHTKTKKITTELPGILNCIVDNIASHNTSTPHQIHPPNSLALYHKHQYIPQSFPTYIRIHFSITQTQKYLCNKYKWSMDTYKSIDWNTQNNSIKKMTSHRQRQCKKYIHNFLPIGKLNFTLQKKCPYCNRNETDITSHHYQDHFILCQKN